MQRSGLGNKSFSLGSRQNGAANVVDVSQSIDHLLEAEKATDQTSFNQVMANLEALPKPSPGNINEATRLNKLGLKNLKAKDYPTAVTFFGLASGADPSDPKYLSNLGFAEMNAGNLDSAVKHLFSSIALSPSRTVAWGDLGEVFAKKGDEGKAVACLLVGYRLSNGETLAYLQSLQGDDDLAIRSAGSQALDEIQSRKTPSRDENNGATTSSSSTSPLETIPPAAPATVETVSPLTAATPAVESTDKPVAPTADKPTPTKDDVWTGTAVPEVGGIYGLKDESKKDGTDGWIYIYGSKDCAQAMYTKNSEALQEYSNRPGIDGRVGLTPPDYQVRVLEIADGFVISTNKPGEYIKKPGAYVHIQLLPKPCKDAYGQPSSGYAAATDLTNGWIATSVLKP